MGLRKKLRRLLRPRESKVLERPPAVWSQWHDILVLAVSGREREGSQLLMHPEMIDGIRGVPGDTAEFGIAAGVSFVRILDLFEPEPLLVSGWFNEALPRW